MSKLPKHIKAIHDSDKPKNFKCTICDYKSSTRMHMGQHMKFVHPESKETPFVRMEGPKHKEVNNKTVQPELQKTPTMTEKQQNGEESSDFYLCAQCDFFTSHPSKLERHVEEAHEKASKESTKDKEKQHFCSKCEFKSTFKHNVVRHMKLKHGQQST